MAKKKRNTYYVNDLDTLVEFYKLYDQSYWIRKSNFLKSTYDNHKRITNYYNKNLKAELGTDNDLFRKSIALDIHFLGFQMIECLFELIFALLKRDQKHLWFEISNSDWKQNDGYIERISKNDFTVLDLNKRVTVQINDQKVQIDKLRWIFYYLGFDRNNEVNWAESIGIIRKVLVIVAQEFVERDSYNSYKHGLRLYNGRFGISISNDNNPNLSLINSSSENGITYLTNKLKNEDTKTKYLIPQKTTELIDIERDHKRNVIVGELIHNIIASRVPYLTGQPLDNKSNINLYFFEGFDTKELYPSATITKFSFGI